MDLIQEQGPKLHAYEIKSAKSFHHSFFKQLHYLKSLLGDSLASTRVIYDGETTITGSDNGIINFRDVEFE